MAKKSPSLAPAEVYTPASPRRGSRVATFLWIVLVLAAAVGGYCLGHFVLSDSLDSGALGGKTSISEDELDKVVATYRYDDEVVSITAREAIAHESSLDALRNADGGYAMPSAESVISAARTAVLMRDVEAHGITVSDEELLAYAAETFGTSDLASLAASYTMDEAAVRERVRESCAIAKLRAEVVPSSGEGPVAPTEPEDGDVQTASADYAAYIIALAGDEWDSERGTWVSDEGPYGNALKGYNVRPDSATYEAAETAYNIAFQLHSDALTAGTTQWSDYVNAQLCEAELALSSLVM